MTQISTEEIDQLAVKTIKMLAVDAVEKARSGHPGMAMGAADLAYVLWTRIMRFAPSNPLWPDRDRFVLSAGHASMLLYSMLHLTGYDLTLDDIKEFRQWGSRTPGHPEYGLTPGVESTTGPLGQGFSMAVGLALAGKRAAARFNDDDFSPVSHRVFVLASDGDLMEGVAHEAASLAGHWGLDNLIAVYDSNDITIEGDLDLCQSMEIAKTFAGYGWKVLKCDGHDHKSITRALKRAVKHEGQPCLVIASTHIGAGSPGLQDCEDCHGSPLGTEELAATKANLGWPEEPAFYVPEEARAPFAKAARRGERLRRKWTRELAHWLAKDPQRTQEWDMHMGALLPENLFDHLSEACPNSPAATRAYSGKVLAEASKRIPILLGGSADLGSSIKTMIPGEESLSAENILGRNVHFGVREHGMAAVCNGMALSGSVIPYASTFLVFADYMRPSIRLSALMGLRVIYVFSHDSILVGEDGPTHQPIEQVAALRLIPNLAVLRPADAAETVAAWTLALTRKDGPTALILSRQKVGPFDDMNELDMKRFNRGGYIAVEAEGAPTAVLMATGSEVSLAIQARKTMGDAGRGLRIVSVPWLERFMEQPAEYRDSVLPPGTRRVSLELGSTMPWRGLVGEDGLCMGIERFGASAPGQVMAERFGFVPERVAESILKWLGA